MPHARRLARDLRRLARACGVAAAAGPGCFLWLPCPDTTHTETQTISEDALEWFAATPPGGPFTGAWLADESIRLAGPNGAARSFDGGATWSELPGAPLGIAAIDAVDGWETWMVGPGGVAGVWREDAFSAGALDGTWDLGDVAVYEGWGGVAVGANGAVFASEDGTEWTGDPDVALLADGATLRAVDLLSNGTAWVVGDGGLVLHDGADGWEVVDLGTDDDLVDVAFASVNRGMVAGAGGDAWWTADAGATWTSAPAPGALTALAFSGAEGDELRLATGPEGVVWSFDGTDWSEVTRTSDGSALTTIAAAGDVAVAAGTGALVLGWVEHLTEEKVEVSDCQPYVGRPYLVGGVARLAPVYGAAPDADPRWLRQAQEEHAAVAAFARFAAQLRALGAPADLVESALTAQADEARHAALALELAGGGTFGALALEEDGPASLVEVAVATAREGCIVETAAVYAAMEAALTAPTPAERRVWRAIVRDETRHAALAWRFVRWAIAQDPAVATAIAPLFATRPAAVPLPVWRDVILPAAAA